MVRILLLSVFGMWLAVPALAVAAASMNIAQQATEQGQAGSAASGAWQTNFLQRQWIFEFSNEEGRWTGRYRLADNLTWRQLDDVTVAGRSVSFRIASQPGLSFVLEVEPDEQSMSGTATVDGFGTVPISATRQA